MTGLDAPDSGYDCICPGDDCCDCGGVRKLCICREDFSGEGRAGKTRGEARQHTGKARASDLRPHNAGFAIDQRPTGQDMASYPVAQGVLGRPLLERGGLLTGSRARRQANVDGSMRAVGGAADLTLSWA